MAVDIRFLGHSAVELTADGRKAEVRLATRLDVTRVVPELHEGVFRV